MIGIYSKTVTVDFNITTLTEFLQNGVQLVRLAIDNNCSNPKEVLLNIKKEAPKVGLDFLNSENAIEDIENDSTLNWCLKIGNFKGAIRRLIECECRNWVSHHYATIARENLIPYQDGFMVDVQDDDFSFFVSESDKVYDDLLFWFKKCFGVESP